MTDSEQQKSETKPEKKAEVLAPKKYDMEIVGIDIDKNEYQEIILSNSNHPESTYYDKFRG